jgi:hypothetical protein
VLSVLLQFFIQYTLNVWDIYTSSGNSILIYPPIGIGFPVYKLN